jgi:hypothetical protein
VKSSRWASSKSGAAAGARSRILHQLLRPSLDSWPCRFTYKAAIDKIKAMSKNITRAAHVLK